MHENDQQSLVKAAMRRLGLDDKLLTPRNVLGRKQFIENHCSIRRRFISTPTTRRRNALRMFMRLYRKEL